MRHAIAVLTLASLTASGAYATSCGTVAAPTSCTITVGGTTKYTFSAFTLVNASSTGSGITYTGADIAIDLATGGGLTASLTFSKSNVNPGVVFLANANDTSGFLFTYQVTLSAAVPGNVAFRSPFTVAIGPSSHLNNGSGAVQYIVSGAPTCQAIVGIGGGQAICTIPAGQPLTIGPGNIVSLAGNSGNVSILNFTNLLDATFTAPPVLTGAASRKGHGAAGPFNLPLSP